MGGVAIVYGDRVEGMVRQLMEETGTMDRLRPDHTVVIKPNLVVSRENWVGVDTDPRVIEAIVKSLKDPGVRIPDSSYRCPDPGPSAIRGSIVS